MDLKIFPWDNGEKPYFINPDNKYEWYIDKSTTDWCSAYRNDLKELDAICFIVAKRVGDKLNPIERVLIDKKTNEVLAVDTSLEGMACKIDFIRLSQSM